MTLTSPKKINICQHFLLARLYFEPAAVPDVRAMSVLDQQRLGPPDQAYFRMLCDFLKKAPGLTELSFLRSGLNPGSCEALSLICPTLSKLQRLVIEVDWVWFNDTTESFIHMLEQSTKGAAPHLDTIELTFPMQYTDLVIFDRLMKFGCTSGLRRFHLAMVPKPEDNTPTDLNPFGYLAGAHSLVDFSLMVRYGFVMGSVLPVLHSHLVEGLVAAPVLQKLTLGLPLLNDEHALRLQQLRGMAQLRHLSLRLEESKLSEEGFEVLRTMKLWSNLKSLQLEFVPAHISDARFISLQLSPSTVPRFSIQCHGDAD